MIFQRLGISSKTLPFAFAPAIPFQIETHAIEESCEYVSQPNALLDFVANEKSDF
jgi:hypothetical protein